MKNDQNTFLNTKSVLYSETNDIFSCAKTIHGVYSEHTEKFYLCWVVPKASANLVIPFFQALFSTCLKETTQSSMNNYCLLFPRETEKLHTVILLCHNIPRY